MYANAISTYGTALPIDFSRLFNEFDLASNTKQAARARTIVAKATNEPCGKRYPLTTSQMKAIKSMSSTDRNKLYSKLYATYVSMKKRK